MTQEAVDSTNAADVALTQAYQRYGRMVYNTCRRMLNTAQAAEDATQAVFLIYIKKAPSLNADTQLGGWFQRTAVLVAREGLRSRMRRRRHEHAAAELKEQSAAATAGPDQDSQWQELRPKLDQAIAALPEKYRTPLVQVYLAGQSQQDVAKALHLNEGTLRWRLSHAIERLREKLGDARYSPVLLLMLLESFGHVEAPPAHILPSLLKAARPHSIGESSGTAPSESVTQYVQGGLNAMFWKRVKLWSAGAASFALICALLAFAVMSHRHSDAEESVRPAANPNPVKATVAPLPQQPTSAKPAANATLAPADAAKKLEGLKIREIQFSGLKAGGADAVSRMIQSQKDKPFAQKTLDDDRQRLLATGKYAQVVVSPMASGNGVTVAFTLVENDPAVSDFGSGPPQMVYKQTAVPNGGRVVLYSRNRYGNYPLATYAFRVGLRGDDQRVRNQVDLVFGNAVRPGGAKGLQVDSVPGVSGAGSCGMDGGARGDTFRVSLYGGSRHKILDLGEVPFETATATAKELRASGDYADVKVNHVYFVRLMEREADAPKPLMIKVKVIQHRDNEGVLIDWEPIQAGTHDDEF